MAKSLSLLFLLLLVSIPRAEARVYLDINAPTFVQIPIVLTKWKALEKTPSGLAVRAHEILSNNLTLSGFFRVIDPSLLPPHLRTREGISNTPSLQEWSSSRGEILLSGELLMEPDRLHTKFRFRLDDLVEQKQLVSAQYEGPLQNLREVVHRISDEIILHLTGERGVHNTKIVFAVQQGEGREIFFADFDGANIKQVTQNQSINISPTWTPDGKKIAFTSYLKRNPDLYLIDLNGLNLQPLSSYQGLNASAAWSPDGKKIALMMGMEGKSDIYLLDANARNPIQLTKGHGNESTPRWSPDGRWITYSSDRSGTPQIYIMSSDGSNVRRLTFEGNYNTSPSWSPKGDRIAFCGRAGGRFHIFTIGTDGSGLKRLTPDQGNNESPCWSPDGRYITFTSTRSGGAKVFVMNSNGFNQRPLTPSKGGESGPAWSIRFNQ